MGAAEGISFEEVRARKQWATLRQHLHERFDHWLDELERRLSEPEPTLTEVTQVVWDLRQSLTGSVTETIILHSHRQACAPP